VLIRVQPETLPRPLIVIYQRLLAVPVPLVLAVALADLFVCFVVAVDFDLADLFVLD
jgi:hypothetical protein